MINTSISPHIVNNHYPLIHNIINPEHRIPQNSDTYNQLLSIINYSSYVPYSGCVFEHIINNFCLTHQEKIYYLIADSLALINTNSDSSKQRSIALPSYDWATRLCCSRSQIFTMQKNLQEKGYFIINKDKNKIGQNNRNIIIPTIPDDVFAQLDKYPDKNGKHVHYNSLTEGKRAYLDRTKLFIKINYQLLIVITSSEYLTPLQKILWLGYYIKCYKYHMLLKKQNINHCYSNRNFSFTTSYRELANEYGITIPALSKAMKALEDLGFIARNNLYVKKGKLEQDRQDKSLWQITLLLPNIHSQELVNSPNRSTKTTIDSSPPINTNITSNNSYIANQISTTPLQYYSNVNRNLYPVQKQDDATSSLIDNSLLRINTTQLSYSYNHSFSNNITNSKTLYIQHDQSQSSQLNIEQQNYDSEKIITEKPIDNLSEESTQQLINKDEIILEQLPLIKHPVADIEQKDISFSDPDIAISDPHFAKFRPLLNKNLKIKNIKDLDSIDRGANFFENSDDFENLSELSVSLKNSLEKEEDAVTIKPKEFNNNFLQDKPITQPDPSDTSKLMMEEGRGVENVPTPLKIPQDNNVVKVGKPLKSYYPLTKEQVDKLNSLAGKRFTGEEFSTNFGNELLLKLSHLYPNNVFLSKNHMMSYMSKAFRYEKHQAPLVNHESFRFTVNVSDPESVEQRKIEKYLSEVEYNFDTSYNSQLRRKTTGLFERKLAYRILTEGQFDYNPVNKQNSEESIIIKLPEDIELTYLQQEKLEGAVKAVYGNIDIIYEKIVKDKKRTIMEEGVKLEDLDQNSTWYKIRRKLKEQYGESIDKTWFSKLISKENLEKQTITLLAPSNFIRDWINSKYGSAIRQISQILGYQFIELVTKE